jgi:hypothetical protein
MAVHPSNLPGPRALALRAGLSRYHGPRCPIHGTTERRTNNRECVHCHREDDKIRKKRLKANPYMDDRPLSPEEQAFLDGLKVGSK